MGRKNRNARAKGYSYTSFENLKNSTVKFDLSNGTFIKKDSSAQSATQEVEVRVSFNKCGHNLDTYISFSLREDIAEKLMKESGKAWCCGIVKEGFFERVYFLPDEYRGYSIYRNKNASKRYYLRLPVYESEADFQKYLGNHELKYDNANEAYYIVADE